MQSSLALNSPLYSSSLLVKKRKRDVALKFQSRQDQDDTSDSDIDVETKTKTATSTISSQRTQSWRAFTRTEEARMIKYWQDSKTFGRHKDRDLAMFILLRRTDLHPGQIVNLKVADVFDTKTKQVMETFILINKKVRHVKSTKSGNVVTKVNTTARTVAIHADARKFILPLCQDKPAQDLLFQHDIKKNKSLKRSTISSAFKYCAQKAGVVSTGKKGVEKERKEEEETDFEDDETDFEDDDVVIVGKTSSCAKENDQEPVMNTDMDQEEDAADKTDIKQGREAKTPEEKKQWRTLYKRQWRKAHPTKAKEAQRKYRLGRKRQKVDSNPRQTTSSTSLEDSKQAQESTEAAAVIAKDDDVIPEAISIFEHVDDTTSSIPSCVAAMPSPIPPKSTECSKAPVHILHTHYLGRTASSSVASINTSLPESFVDTRALPSSFVPAQGSGSSSLYYNPATTSNANLASLASSSTLVEKYEKYLVQEQELAEAKTRLLEMDRKLQEKETQTSQLLNLVTKASVREDHFAKENEELKRTIAESSVLEARRIKELDDAKRQVANANAMEDQYRKDMQILSDSMLIKKTEADEQRIKDVHALIEALDKADALERQCTLDLRVLSDVHDALDKAYWREEKLEKAVNEAKSAEAKTCTRQGQLEHDLREAQQSKDRLQRYYLQLDKDAIIVRENLEESLKNNQESVDTQAKMAAEFKTISQQLEHCKEAHVSRTELRMQVQRAESDKHKEKMVKVQAIAQRLEEMHSEMANKPLPERSTTTLYTYSPGVKALMKTTKKLGSDETIPETRVLCDDPTYHTILFKYDKTFTKCVFVPMEDAIKEWIAARKGQRDIRAPFNALYTKTEVKTITGRDPRKALRGSKGLFVRPRKMLEWKEFIGFYEGWCTEDDTHSELIGTMQSVAFNEYAMGPDTKFVNKQLAISAMGDFGNDTRFANDRRNFTDRSKDLKVNAKFFEIVYQGMPYIALIALGHIGEGEEIIVDYEDAYWETMDMVRTKQTVQTRVLHQLKTLCSEMAELV